MAAHIPKDAYGILQYPVHMRAFPTFKYSGSSKFELVGNGSNKSFDMLKINESSTSTIQMTATSNAGAFSSGTACWLRFVTGEPFGEFIEFDAEL